MSDTVKNYCHEICSVSLSLLAASGCQRKTSCAARWPPQYAPAPADRRPISGQFVVRGEELPTAYVLAKLEDRSFFRLRNTEGVPKFGNWSTCPRRRPISGQFVVRGKNCPRPMCMPNLKIVAFSVCEILRGSQNFDIGAPAPGDAQFLANLWSGARTAHDLCAYQIGRA